MKVKEENEKAGLKLNIPKTKIMVSGPITSWQLDGETMKTVTDYFLGLQNHCRVIAAMKLKDTSLWKKSYDSILKSGDITLLTKVHLVKVMVSNSHIWM